VTDTAKIRSANRRLSVRLLVVALAMFGFGYTILPLFYDTVRDVTGLGGEPAASSLPWEVQPTVTEMRINPGRVYEATYFARNLSSNGTVGIAKPNINPGKAAVYFTSPECFCFSEQKFNGGERRELPLRFVVAAQLPPNVRTITLSYIFFNAETRS
jgi:cytochrome c oxidase assembly protein subunit 11